MKENYTVAALRHWQDAQLLEKQNRVANADQLYGFAAECAIKKALVLVRPFADAGTLRDPYKEHIAVLWNRANHQSLQKCAPTLPTLLRAGNPFADWDVSQRYGDDSDITLEAMGKHRDAAKRLLGAVGLTGVRSK